MKELMIHVERVVRPIRAAGNRKDRMREELLAHLTGIFEEELARSGDRDAALEEARRRFGEPAALARELQESVPRIEVPAAAVENWLTRRRGEKAADYAVRLGVCLFLFNVLAFALPSALRSIVTGQFPADGPTALRLGATALLLGTIASVALGALYFRVRAALYPSTRAARSWSGALAWALLGGLVVLASGFGFTLVNLASVDASVELLRLWLAPTIGASAMLCISALMLGPAQLRHLEWVNLDIGE